MSRYRQFEAEDFALDAYFQHWVLHPDQDVIRFWENFLQAHPEKRSTIEEAILLVQSAGLTGDEDEDAAFLDSWHKIDTQIKRQRTRRMVQYAAMAAAFTGLVALGYIYAFSDQVDQRFATGYAESSTITLADGSVINLQANSELLVMKPTWWKSQRRVRLEGEAFFTVAHDAQHPFVVTTPEGLTVKVLGTRFNVQARHATSTVYLASGRVSLATDERETAMVPGMLAEHRPEGAGLLVHTATPTQSEAFISWTKDQYTMRDTPLAEVAVHIADIFGKRVVWKQESLKQRQITARVPLYDLPVLLRVIEETLQVRAVVKNDSIEISSE